VNRIHLKCDYKVRKEDKNGDKREGGKQEKAGSRRRQEAREGIKTVKQISYRLSLYTLLVSLVD
jgi:hypothetical protein